MESNVSIPPMTVVAGSSRNFRGVPEPGDNDSRPLMVNAWSQTTSSDFTYVAELEQQDQQSQREKELEEKIKVLEENLKVHTDLLSQIHATSARTSALLGQQLTYPSQENEHKHTTHSNNLNYNGRAQQISPRNVSSEKASPINSVINPLQQVNCSTADSIKYTIIAEGSGNHNGEPIEIHLAEDDGAINLNNSTDSGRLEICLAPEENVDIKTEENDDNNKAIEQSSITTQSPNEHHFVKKRKLTMDQSEMLSINSNYLLNNQDDIPSTSGQSSQKRRSSNSVLKIPKIEHSSKNANDVQIPTISMQDSMSSSHNIFSAGEHINIGAENVMISLGPNNTRISAKVYETISWASASIATRKLLMAIFDRKTLATHSMTGKPSPAFKDHGKPLKQMLDPLVIADIIFTVTRKCKVSDKEVRNAITTKCADENKMMKLQMNKRTPMKEMNKENVVG
ncbi:hypothetical protein DOY81_003670 [Sarcophaga bullata]|nr:hypothetical protein DOY81_003670 [Sarcophaga bullata]